MIAGWILIIGFIVAGVVPGRAGETSASNEVEDVTERRLGVGFDQTEGNSHTLLTKVNGKINIVRADYSHRLEVNGAYGESEVEAEDGSHDTETTAQNLTFQGETRRMVSPRNYLQFTVSAEHDEIAALQYRVKGGPSFGRYWIKETGNRFSADAGLSYMQEKVQQITAEGITAYRLSSRWERKLNEHVQFTIAGEYLPRVEDVSDSLFNSEVGLETAITSILTLKTAIKNNYDSTPAADKRRNDMTLGSMLMVKL